MLYCSVKTSLFAKLLYSRNGDATLSCNDYIYSVQVCSLVGNCCSKTLSAGTNEMILVLPKDSKAIYRYVIF
jgi:hypothetical protein